MSEQHSSNPAAPADDRPWRWLCLPLAVPLVFFSYYSLNPTFLPLSTQAIIGAAGFGLGLCALLAGARLAPVEGRLLFLLLLCMLLLPLNLALFAEFSLQLAHLLASVLVQAAGAAVLLWLWLRRQADPLHAFLVAFCLAGLLQSGFIAVSYFVEAFREWTVGFLPATGNIDPLRPDRVRGLTHSSGATLGVKQGLVFLAATLLLLRSARSAPRLLALVTLPLALFAVLVTGRTGLLLVLAALLFAALELLRGRRRLALLAGGGGLTLVLALASPRLLAVLDPATVDWLLRDARPILAGRPWEAPTLQVLLSHYTVPSDWRILLIGSPPSWHEARVAIDPGYVRLLFALGAVGTAAFYGAVLLLGVHLAGRGGPLERRFYLTLLATFLILELKEPFLIRPEILFVFVVLLLLARLASSPTPAAARWGPPS